MIYVAGSYVIEALPSLLFQAVHVKFPTLIGHINLKSPGTYFLRWGSLILSGLSIENSKTDPEFYFRLIQTASVAAILFELTVTILLPQSLTVQLAVRGVVLFCGFVGNARSIYDGSCRIQKSLTDSNLKTSKKVSEIVLGLITVGFGTLGSITTLQNAANLYKGFRVYQTLDHAQQTFALKYHGLESLGQAKPQTAVIISGRSPEWAEPKYKVFDNTPDPAANVVYHNYKARVYEVTSSENLSSVLDQASKELGKPIDLIYFSGHANNQVMKLNSNYFFTANLIETNAINKNISSTAHIILAGCETAKPDSEFKSLAKLVSQRLPKALVTGFFRITISILFMVMV